MGDTVTPDQPQRLASEGEGGASPEVGDGGYAGSLCSQILPRSGSFQSQGPRDYQEDRVSAFEEFLASSSPGRPCVELYAVFDGHGGTAAVDFVLEKLPDALHSGLRDFHSLDAEQVKDAMSRAFEETEAELLEHIKRIPFQVPSDGPLPRTRSVVPQTGLSAGTCACVAVLYGNILYLANLGDCRALLRTHTGTIQLTQDHRPLSDVNLAEKTRLENLGISVSSDGYIHGQIGVSRSLGDMRLETGEKCPGLLACPEVCQHQLGVGTEFLLLVCDGILEKMEPEEACNIVRRALRDTKDPRTAAQKLVEDADLRQSPDNLSAVVVLFKVPPPSEHLRRAPRPAWARRI
eukprot:TRINITY_DN1675_c0_g1_i1.p1 TRINITY_DN1675_c0_g1~~TRINITY_DN1675_c0_g1_i1.p1  ORF type:complete len:349 (-),score=61.51 TRINITY_DN1675_c0_g1_i1:152-1198(-)